MIKIENTEVVGWEAAIRGMRNPMNSWEKSDSEWDESYRESSITVAERYSPWETEDFQIGPDDQKLMMRLRNAGTDHRKFMRMIVVYADIVAPLYWIAELDTYKVGTVKDSCSFMHKGCAKPFSIDDFSLHDSETHEITDTWERTIQTLNDLRKQYLDTKDEQIFQAIRCLLPQGYNQRATYMFNYEVLANIYRGRKNHRLEEWHNFCHWIESLPYSELITGPREEKEG